MPAGATAMAAARPEPPNSASPPPTYPSSIMITAASRATGTAATSSSASSVTAIMALAGLSGIRSTYQPVIMLTSHGPAPVTGPGLPTQHDMSCPLSPTRLSIRIIPQPPGALTAAGHSPRHAALASVVYTPGMRRRHQSARRAESRSGWFEKAQDQKTGFLAQLLVIPGITFAHCFGGDRLDEFFDEESSIGGRRAQARQRFTPKVHWLVSRWGMPDVGFQGGLEVGAAFAQPVHHRVLRRYHRCPAGAQDPAELGEGGRAVAGVVNGQRADDEVEGAIAVGQRVPERRPGDPRPACRPLPGQGHHHRARIKGGDLSPSLQQFTQ